MVLWAAYSANLPPDSSSLARIPSSFSFVSIMQNQKQDHNDSPSPKPSNLTAMNVASLLNPVKSEHRERGTRLPSSPSPSIPISSSTSAHGSPHFSSPSPLKKPKMTKDGAVFTKGKIKGEVRYPPFENLDEETVHGMQRFQVYPIGKIQEYPRHIPYNSEKKTFLERTGRESFEVFQYVFKVPGDDKEYAVMWDYNIGLVRITPFFKCCKYTKTTPAKMLGHNPGLKEITHSITGGALAAQGYWMPYHCALAICATFCHHIAPALIPIFGPSFPSLCVLPEAPEHGRMVIDPSLIHSATTEAASYRAHYASSTPSFSRPRSIPPSPASGFSSSPQSQQNMRATPPRQTLDRRLRLKRTFGDSSYGETDTEASGSSGEYFVGPPTPNSARGGMAMPQVWRNANMGSHSANSSINISPPFRGLLPNPILSAIPRSTGLPEHWRGMPKRRIEEEHDADAAYDGEESANASVITDDKSVAEAKPGETERSNSDEEKKAAFWLLNLHIEDRKSGGIGVVGTREQDQEDLEGPMKKRRRETLG